MSEPAVPDEETKEERAPTLESVAFGWWSGLQELRGDRADLRRCGRVADVQFTVAYHRLLKRVGPVLEHERHDFAERLAVAAGVLSHVREQSHAVSLAQLLAGDRGGAAKLSGLRFRRLIQADSPDEVLVAVTRSVHLVDNVAPISSLARDLVEWSDAVRKRWAFRYYEAAPDEP